MRVGLLTSWRVPCGIYQYSARLADALAGQDGVEVVILAGRADEHRSVPEESEHEVHDVAKIGLWRDDRQYDIDMDAVRAAGPLDVLHVQYQSMLFSQQHLRTLALRHHNHGPVAVTYHDNCIAPDFPHNAFGLHFSHRWDVGPFDVETLDFGVEDRPPVVRSFGLGRTRSDFIEPICKANGWIYESAASHESIQGGGQSWKPHEELIAWLRGADAIVLWYDEQPMAGSSQAARTALAARRPVFTNDTKWFEDLPAHMLDGTQSEYYRKCDTLEALEQQLGRVFDRKYVTEHSWDKVAQTLVARFSATLVRA